MPDKQIARAAALALTASLVGGAADRALGVTIETVRVGSPGNADDIAYSSAGAFGAVDYAYEIGTYEVTNDQYVEFLNAVAATDFNSLYHSEMTNNGKGGVVRNGSPGGYSYEVKPNMGDKPVISVNLWDAARFVNWLHNGQPAGLGQTDTTTEDGVYDLDGLAPSSTITWERKEGATWFLPTEDEWYKAAYYDPRSAADGGPTGDNHYWRYPTQSDDDPTAATADSVGNIANPGPNVANYDNASWNGSDYNLTTVGSAGPSSASYFGTYDQGGNIAELTESPYLTGYYVSRGGGTGSMYSASRPSKVSAATRGGADPAVDHPSLGFRVGKMAEPLEAIPGDYNSDGVVDAADYTAWRDALGTGIVLPGDETPGTVDNGDYEVWRSNYGQSSAGAESIGSHAVPEPTGLPLLGLGAALGAASRREP